jgi:hypothetical protein
MGGQLFGLGILWFAASLFGAHLRPRHEEEPAS